MRPSDEWYTPPEVIKDARRVMGSIDTDPASSRVAQKVVQASIAWLAGEGLENPWVGNVWLNPPFSNPAPFVEAMIAKWATDRQPDTTRARH